MRQMLELSYSVLIVSSSEKFNKVFSELLSGSAFRRVSFSSSVSNAKRELAERSYDVIIINSPVHDDAAERFTYDISKRSDCVVMFAADNKLYADYYEKMTQCGVFLLRKPSTRALLESAISWLCTARERVRRTEAKERSVDDKMQEIRLVNQAKWKLIRERGIDESEAHRIILKMSMDRSMTKAEVAEIILYNKK